MFQYVIPALKAGIGSGGVYLGVGPEQNFTYIAALEPRIAFIFDIRRQNMLTHLIYKSLFELAPDRADFLSLLFSRRRPPGLRSDSDPEALFDAYAMAVPDREAFQENLKRIKNHLIETNGFGLTAEDQERIDYVYAAFFAAGPDLNYSFQTFSPAGGRMPTYADLMTADDGQGENRSYLANETNYRLLQRMHRKNLIIPLVGDFAGDKAISMVAQYLRDHEAAVSVFYTSNVEQYLFQQAPDWNRFYINVGALPLEPSSTFIRSVSANRPMRVPLRGPGRFISVLCSVRDLMTAFNSGHIHYYDDVIRLSQ
jgi:hypothetical protein